MSYKRKQTKYMLKFPQDWADFEFVQRTVAQIPNCSNNYVIG